jgi:hypothetical protein
MVQQVQTSSWSEDGFLASMISEFGVAEVYKKDMKASLLSLDSFYFFINLDYNNSQLIYQ